MRALWLSGSRGRGAADAWSDLDLVVTVADASFETFTAAWRKWLAEITPTVLAREIPGLPGSCYTVTPEWERLDVVVERVSAVAGTPFREREVVFGRDGLAGGLPPPGPDPPSPVRVEFLVTELWRALGLLTVITGREDWALGQEAVHGMRMLLVQLFLQANAPQPATGIKRMLDRLSPEQRAVVESIALPPPRRDEVMAGHLAVAAAFVPTARELCERLGVEWPAELEAATRAHLRRELGLEVPG